MIASEASQVTLPIFSSLFDVRMVVMATWMRFLRRSSKAGPLLADKSFCSDSSKACFTSVTVESSMQVGEVLLHPTKAVDDQDHGCEKFECV